MTMRNPQNERYTSDEKHTGVARKSAASAKPASKAASSVTITDPSKKTPQQKKAARKERERKERDENKRWYNPNTPTYRKWRTIWAVCLVLGLVGIILLMCFQEQLTANPAVFMVLTIVSYVLIIAVVFIDVSKLSKERRRFTAMMKNPKSDEYKAYMKSQRENEERLATEIKEARAEAVAKAVSAGEDTKAAGDLAEEEVRKRFDKQEKSKHGFFRDLMGYY